MPQQSKQFAERVLAAFREAGLRTDAEVGQAGGPSTTTMTGLRKAARDRAVLADPRAPTLARIDQAAGWKPGSAALLWAEGREPELTEEARVIHRREPRRGGYNTTRIVLDLADQVADLQERLALLEGLVLKLIETEPVRERRLALVQKFLGDPTDETGPEDEDALTMRSELRVYQAAARNIGKPSAGQRRRADADQAGEPPADDPDDFAPR